MKKQLLFLAGIIFSLSLFPQEYREMMNKSDANLYDIQKSFNDYWKDKDSTQKGNGYKVFKRLEYFAERRVYPSGNLSQLSLTAKNYSDFLKNNSGSNAKIASTTWTALGPFGALNFPAYPQYVAAGRLDFLRIDINNTNVMYTGSPTGGLWKTTDGGLTWSTATDNLPVTGFSDLAIDPSNSNILYLATGDGNTSYCNSIGVLKSTDGGATWNTTGLTYSVTQNRHILRLVINSSNPQIVIAATNNGIWRTTDGGATWNLSLNQNLKDMEYRPSDPNTVYASGYYGFWKSTDGGASFSQISSGIPTSGFNGMSIGVTPADADYVYAIVTSTNGGFGGFYRSTDAGTTFSAMNTSTYNILGYSPTTSGGQGSYNLCIDVHPALKNIVTVGGIYPWYTTNGGTSFTQLTSVSTPTFIHPDTHDITYSATGSEIFISNDGGLHKYSSNTITNMTGNMNIAEIYKIGLSSLTPDLWITGLQDNGSSIHSASTYSFTLGADGMDCFFDRTNNNNVFGSSQFGGFEVSSDGGMNWSGAGWFPGTAAWIAPWHQDPSVPTTIYAAKTDVWKSTNMGTTFNSLSPITAIGGYVTEFEVAPSNNQVLYVIKGGKLFRSGDGGVSWTDVSAGLPTSVAYPTYITINPTDENKVWITFSGYSAGNKIYKTINGGITWTNVSYNLPNIPANTSVYLPSSNDAIYVGMDVGVYYMDNTMSSWTLYNTGLPNVEISQLKISPAAPTKLRAATYGRGVYEVDILAAPLGSFSIAAIPYCAGQNIQFTDLSTLSPNGWAWNVNPSAGVVITSPSSQNPQISFPSPGNYSVTLIPSNVIGPGNPVTQTITVNAPPTVSVAAANQTICIGEYVVFSVSGASTYTWSNGGGNNTLAIYGPTTAATYTVYGQATNGCITAVPLSVAVDPCVGINELKAGENSILVYPNPNQGVFTVEVKNETEISLYSAIGSELLRKKVSAGKTELTISNLASGIYYLKSVSGNKSTVIKLVKEK